jgi:hypothetical protein
MKFHRGRVEDKDHHSDINVVANNETMAEQEICMSDEQVESFL